MTRFHVRSNCAQRPRLSPPFRFQVTWVHEDREVRSHPKRKRKSSITSTVEMISIPWHPYKMGSSSSPRPSLLVALAGYTYLVKHNFKEGDDRWMTSLSRSLDNRSTVIKTCTNLKPVFPWADVSQVSDMDPAESAVQVATHGRAPPVNSNSEVMIRTCVAFLLSEPDGVAV